MLGLVFVQQAVSEKLLPDEAHVAQLLNWRILCQYIQAHECQIPYCIEVVHDQGVCGCDKIMYQLFSQAIKAAAMIAWLQLVSMLMAARTVSVNVQQFYLGYHKQIKN